ncbi:MAG: purine-nucleoside phosphorylase [Armatimonadetes bacterium]|nr:purine-nucleoside phosphorylase [Armatimonadota bacterium]
MESLRRQIDEAAAFVRKRSPEPVQIGMILGSGLGVMAEEVEDAVAVDYRTIPHFAISTVVGHTGELVLGTLAGQRVAVMRGRLHYYEGYTLGQVSFPVRVMRALGASFLIVTNSAGGLNPRFGVGDLMLITDHINLMGANPLRGTNDERLGPRFPPMARAYDVELRRLVHQCAAELGMDLHEGVYVGLSGPAYETPAEIRFLSMIGADAVGMSTVPEVTVANHAGLRVLGISCVTNVLHQGPSEDTHQDVVDAALKASPGFLRLIRKLLERIPK